jgi:hypothetical protein
MEPGDWVEGEPKWWWKYVYPARDRFWAELIASTSKAEPGPSPWVQSFTADVLEGVAMVRASGTTKDKKVSTRLREEGFKKITDATHVAQRAEAA